jgi:NADH-quinone oxidoreductase subunit N
VTTFFATAPKAAALALTLRVTLTAFGLQSQAWQQVVVFIALASIVLGALGAIGQGNIKRLMAYSSINNVGFMLVGLAAATPGGASAVLVYLAIYVVTSLVGFVAILMLRDANDKPVEAIADLAGLSRSKPGLAFVLAMVMFSLAGIPPLFGFWGKFVVFQAAVAAGYTTIATIAVLGSVIGGLLLPEGREGDYFDEPADKVAGKGDALHTSLLYAGAIAISPVGYLVTGWLGGYAATAAAALFHAV